MESLSKRGWAAVGALALVGGMAMTPVLSQVGGGQAGAPAAPPAAAGFEYAVLEKVELASTRTPEAAEAVWKFSTGAAEVRAGDVATLLKQMGVPENARRGDAVVVNAAAGLGWELVSHTAVASVNSDDPVRPGSTLRTGEEWWFRRAMK